MPPKKKKGKKKGKGKKKKDDAELELEDKYRKTMDEIEALKDHLAVRKEIARRSQSHGDEWKAKMTEAREELENKVKDHSAVSADMTRQYKTMQTDLSLRLDEMDSKLKTTQAKLKDTEDELSDTKADRDRILKEKNAEIEDLRLKINSLELSYEGIIGDTLDSLIEKVKVAQKKWSDDTELIAHRNAQTLLEFGLNPLDLLPAKPPHLK